MDIAKNKLTLVGILLSICIAIIYCNTINYPFFFDDKPNILANTKVHKNSIYEINYKNLFFAEDNQLALRPLAYLSLSLNWIISKTDTTSYHIFNILIHIISSLVLLKTSIILFYTPVLKRIGLSTQGIMFTAIFATFLWALNPIQTQAVTYIVQSMASMAAMFTICCLFFYIKARLIGCFNKKISIFLYLASFSFFLLGFYSKENAALVPLFILLIEIIFFDTLKLSNKKTVLIILFVLLFSLFFTGFFS